jgi:adenylate cyclase
MRLSFVAVVLVYALIAPVFSGAQTVVDSLSNLLKEQPGDSTRVKILNELCSTLSRAQPERAMKYGEQARDLGLKIGYQKGVAYAHKNLGLTHYRESKYSEALIEWSEALAIFDSLNDKKGQANMLNNIGAIYADKGDFIQALDYYLKSLKFSEDLRDSLRIATALNNIGSIYENDPNTYVKAIEYYKRGLEISEKIEYADGIGVSAQNIGQLYLSMNKHKDALGYYLTSEEAFRGIGENNYLPLSLASIGKIYGLEGNYHKARQYHEEAIEISTKYSYQVRIAQSLVKLAETEVLFKHYPVAIKNYLDAERIALAAGAKTDLRSVYEGLSDLYARTGDFKAAYQYQQMFIQVKNDLYKEDTAKELQKLQFGFEIEKKETQIRLLTKDKALKDLEIEKQTVTRNALMVGLAFLLLLAFFLYSNYKQKDKTSKILSKQNAEIMKQKEEIETQKLEIEKLILNILPNEVAQELRKTGKATPRYYESVTVLFTDFKEFSRIAEVLSAQELVADLNECFIAFDRIIEEFGLEKIKTIGDAYMCACGIPTSIPDHPLRTVRAALAIQKYIETENESRRARGTNLWELRIGIHTGPVIAGVVGRKKFAYDIWGNAVNLASRLESNGKEGKVNISESTYYLIKDHFDCEYRGKIYAKNIGDVDMYFVEKEILAEEVTRKIEA